MHTLKSLLVLFSLAVLPIHAAEIVDLAGKWRVELDRTDAGRTERWFTRGFATEIALPGSLQTARLGDPITVETKWTGGIFDKSYFTAPEFEPYRRPGNIKVPFWLQPETHFTGAAWYQREIEIPASWAGRRITLFLERPHWTTTAWLDDVELGSSNANSVAHVYELPRDLAPGRHRLTLCVDNRLDPDIGENSHSMSDHTQGNWNGIVGRIELRSNEPVWIESLAVTGRVADRVAVVHGTLRKREGQVWPKSVTLVSGSVSVSAAILADGSFVGEMHFSPAAAQPWDEFSPVVQSLRAKLENGESLETSFGFREVGRVGRQLMVNQRPLFLRGTLDCAIYPRTGHPPTDVSSWRKVFRVIKNHGLNHVRFHSWCPPEAAFAAADELGVYLQVEVASWPNWSTTLGDGKPVDAWIDAETARILRAYGNHPSFIILCAGNEPGGANHAAWLARWVARQKIADPRRLYTAGAGWPSLPENDLHLPSAPRIQHWAEGLASRINSQPPETRSDYSDYIRAQSAPVVSHEIGQWCVYPNFAEMPKYTGYLKPKNFEIFRESLAAHGMLQQAHDFLISSGKLQALCYKEDIESALRTPEMGGFQLLSLQDFPGQGTALVGVLDPFWEEKGYISPEEFRRFCNSTVPLARLDKRVFTADEHFAADVEVAHFGAAPLRNQSVAWRLLDDRGTAVLHGALPARDISVGAANPAGRIDVPLADLSAPARYRLVVELPGTKFANDWDIWVYPPAVRVAAEIPAEVTIVSQLDARTLAKLEAGEAVWLMAGKTQVRPDAKRGPIAFGFSSIFWNTAWTNGQPPHTFGVLCDPKHPALSRFPTDSFSNWQWWYPITKAAPMILDGLPRDLQPIVQIVDDWVTNRKLGLVFEARVGNGRILVSSVDLRDAVLDPVRRQLRASLLAYVTSKSFQPQTAVSVENLRRIFNEASSR